MMSSGSCVLGVYCHSNECKFDHSSRALSANSGTSSVESASTPPISGVKMTRASTRELKRIEEYSIDRVEVPVLGTASSCVTNLDKFVESTMHFSLEVKTFLDTNKIPTDEALEKSVDVGSRTVASTVEKSPSQNSSKKGSCKPKPSQSLKF